MARTVRPQRRVSRPDAGGGPPPVRKARPFARTSPLPDGASAPKRGASRRPGRVVAGLARIAPGSGQTVHESGGEARWNGRPVDVRIE